MLAGMKLPAANGPMSSLAGQRPFTRQNRLRRIGAMRNGFTLLELLVVMVIIGLLAGFVGPRLFAQVGKSEIKAARAQISGLQKALDQYRIDTGRYPVTEQGLAALNDKPADEPKWSGPYLSKAVPKDPWGRDYIYRSPGVHGEFDLSSRGPDKAAGSAGDNVEIVSW